MNRPLHIWMAFGLSFAVLLAAMGWVSWTALRLDNAQQRAAQQAEIEEKARLALWRMDSSLAPIIIEESARPYQAYDSFPAASRAYTKGGTSYEQGDVLVPSPLLAFASSNILLHFQFYPGEPVTSPQVPTGKQRRLAETSYTTGAGLDSASERLNRLQQLLSAAPVSLNGNFLPLNHAQWLQQHLRAAPVSLSRGVESSTLNRPSRAPQPVKLSNNCDLLIGCATLATNVAFASATKGPPLTPELINAPAQAKQQPVAQEFRSQVEWNARANQQAQQRVAVANSLQSSAPAAVAARVSEGFFTPVWIDQELVLVRRVDLGTRFIIQGCWLNWTNLKQSLLASVRDLFPSPDLQPIQTTGELQARVLAALPAKLVTGPVKLSVLPMWSPVRFSLAVAWTCILLAGAAVALLLHGTVSLSERRAAFVSAVTHELRTPLTTFKMYSEMLAEGMVPDAEKRKHYLDTLCSEANRLSHLVENVLAYARLERGSARSRVEKVSLGHLIERVQDRLNQRAAQAGMKLVVDGTEDSLKTLVHVDVSAIEQILFNLVDNACKYAAPAAGERLIHLEARPVGKFAMLRVRDHGPGISAEGAKRLFKPFSKSAHEAAHTAPGVGLGLALCRRLSRSMGGDLRLDDLGKGGACFVLTLPVSQPDAVGVVSASIT